MTTTSTLGRALGAALIAATVALAGVAGPSVVDAGEEGPDTASITINYNVEDGEPGTAASLTQAEADGLDPELFDTAGSAPADISGTAVCDEPDTATSPNPTNGRGYQKVLECDAVDVTGAAFDFGVANLPNHFYIRNINCYNESQGSQSSPPPITPAPGDTWECYVNIFAKPLVYIDKVVLTDDQCVGFASNDVCLLGADDVTDPADFTLEVYDADGELVPVDAPIIDSSRDVCVPDNDEDGEGGEGGGIIIPLPPGVQSFVTPVEESDCAAVPLAPGSYTMGEVLPTHGYEAAFLQCFVAQPGGSEMLPSPSFDFTVSEESSESTYCTLYNTYVTQIVTADVVVEGDDPGPATSEDFVISVIKTVGGQDVEIVATGVDPALGEGNASAEFELPIGAYRLAVDVPEGYTASVVVAAVPDPSNQLRPVDGAAANVEAPAGPDFTLTRLNRAAGVVTVSFAAPATTTTTTTTSVAPTTAAPTTAAPTTAGPSTTIATLLPATGNDAGQTTTLMLLAIGLFVLGGGVVLATRRH
jgi:hypothetical protein